MKERKQRKTERSEAVSQDSLLARNNSDAEEQHIFPFYYTKGSQVKMVYLHIHIQTPARTNSE